MNRSAIGINSAVRETSLSAIKEMAIRSSRIAGAMSLAWGLPSFRTPDHVRAAAVTALAGDPDVGKYTLPDGLPELRRRAAERHLAVTGQCADPDRNIIVTAGNMEGLKVLLQTLIEPGDEVVVTDPGFTSHIQQIRYCGGRPLYLPLVEADGWRPEVERLAGLVTERTKAIVLVTPSNPTGVLFVRDDLLAIARLASERQLMVIVDDPYSPFVYDGVQGFSHPASLPQLFETLAYLFTFSKAHAMSGWRLGYMVVPEWLKSQVLKVHDATLICAPRISQMAGIAALEPDSTHVGEFRGVLAKRRDLICERLNRLTGVFNYVVPQGAYYVFPRILVDHTDSFAFSVDLLERARVAVTPGSAFGPSGENHVRMAYCVAEDQINLSFDRMEAHFGAG